MKGILQMKMIKKKNDWLLISFIKMALLYKFNSELFEITQLELSYGWIER